jgi:hypothetical protein
LDPVYTVFTVFTVLAVFTVYPHRHSELNETVKIV